MTTDQSSGLAPFTAEAVAGALHGFLTKRIKTELAPDQDLFKSGLVSSMFAMELVVHLEEAYDIAIIGPELKLDHFRTIEAMTSLVLRLRAAAGTGEDG
jgi:methoxymalonate biosynthesis acyl carrier protein